MLLEYKDSAHTADPKIPLEGMGGNLFVVHRSAIIYFESEERCTRFYTTTHGSILARGNISGFEKIFDSEAGFERVSREAILKSNLLLKEIAFSLYA